MERYLHKLGAFSGVLSQSCSDRGATGWPYNVLDFTSFLLRGQPIYTNAFIPPLGPPLGECFFKFLPMEQLAAQFISNNCSNIYFPFWNLLVVIIVQGKGIYLSLAAFCSVSVAFFSSISDWLHMINRWLLLGQVDTVSMRQYHSLNGVQQMVHNFGRQLEHWPSVKIICVVCALLTLFHHK